jgi:hypothetical protein
MSEDRKQEISRKEPKPAADRKIGGKSDNSRCPAGNRLAPPNWATGSVRG